MTEPLVMHYAPGILAVLKTEHCPVQPHYGDIGCDQEHVVYRIIHLTLLQPDEETWVLEQCLLARKAEQLLTGQDA